MNRRKSTFRAKLKAASQKERLQIWKEHFKNLLENPPEVTNKTIKKIICSQLDLRQFMKEELDAVQKKKLKAEKVQATMKYLLEYRRQENLMTYFFDYAMLSKNKTQ